MKRLLSAILSIVMIASAFFCVDFSAYSESEVNGVSTDVIMDYSEFEIDYLMNQLEVDGQIFNGSKDVYDAVRTDDYFYRTVYNEYSKNALFQAVTVLEVQTLNDDVNLISNPEYFYEIILMDLLQNKQLMEFSDDSLYSNVISSSNEVLKETYNFLSDQVLNSIGVDDYNKLAQIPWENLDQNTKEIVIEKWKTVDEFGKKYSNSLENIGLLTTLLEIADTLGDGIKKFDMLCSISNYNSEAIEILKSIGQSTNNSLLRKAISDIVDIYNSLQTPKSIWDKLEITGDVVNSTLTEIGLIVTEFVVTMFFADVLSVPTFVWNVGMNLADLIFNMSDSATCYMTIEAATLIEDEFRKYMQLCRDGYSENKCHSTASYCKTVYNLTLANAYYATNIVQKLGEVIAGDGSLWSVIKNSVEGCSDYNSFVSICDSTRSIIEMRYYDWCDLAKQLYSRLYSISFDKKYNSDTCYYDGHTYKIFDIAMTWTEAKEYCENMGGHLVTLTSRIEDQIIYDFVSNSNYEFAEFWAGGSDFNSEGNWYWVTNEVWEYSNWGKGEPDNNGNNQHYLCVCLEEKSGLGWSCDKTEWDDVDDNRLKGMGFVCEWDNYISYNPTINNEHQFEKTVIQPTCIEDGYTVNKCIECDLLRYSDYVSATGHNYNYAKTISPTCTEKGYDLYTCSICGATEKRNYVNALGHKYEFTKIVAPTCSSQGYDLYTCSVCGSTEKRNYVNALGHQYEFIKTVEPTCEEKGYDLYTCTVCQSTEQRNLVNALGHKYEVVSNTATCTEAGVKTSVCSICGKTMETEVSALGHSYDSVYTSPTCTESGGYVNTCTRCGYVETIEYSAKGHDYGQLYGKEYLDAISNSNISSTPGYIGEYYSTSSSIGSDTTSSINSSTVSFPNEIRLDIDHINDISEYQFSIKGGWFNFRTFDCIFICDNTTGRLPEQSAIPYTDKEGNLVNMKYVDYKVNGEWLCGEYILNGEKITDLAGEIICSQFEETRPHIVFTRHEALDNGVMNVDGTVNVDYKLIDENEISFATGIPGIYFASTHITATLSRKYFVAFGVDESMQTSIKPGKYELELYFYNSSKNAIGKTTIKIYDSDELIKVTPATEYSNEKITYTCIDCGETEIKEIIKTDPDALEAAIEMFDNLNSVDYSTESYSNLSNVVEEYRGVIETAQTQQEIDDAVTAILEAMYDLVPNLNLNVSAENGSYEVQYDSTTSSDSKYSLLFGTEVTLTATANDGYKFIGWYDETSGVYLSKDSTYTFKITANINIKAVFVEEQSATLTFTTYCNWVKEEITKTVDEWNEMTSIEDLLPEVPYRYGYSNGRWVYDNEDVLSKLRAGENVSIVAEYDEDDTSLPTPPTPNGDVPVLDLYYKLDEDENIGSFVMATGIPENCQIESVGMAFYYKNANQFDPENFELLLNNKMLTSTFDIDESDIYIANIERFTSKNNWAARGYITYYDADGNLKTVYSNQINIVGREQV